LPFFFAADWGEGHFNGIVRVLDCICVLAGLADVSPHTLRHTFASVAALPRIVLDLPEADRVFEDDMEC
jgi:hypothetical protein